jgi:hypothetical protein
MCCCPLPSSNVRSPASGSGTRSQHPSVRASGSAAPSPSAMDMKDGKIAVVESEAEQVRLIYRRYLELQRGECPGS